MIKQIKNSIRPLLKVRLFEKIIYKYIYKYFAKDYDKYLLGITNRSKENVKFLQIGANDGRINDPIYKYVKYFGWRGTFVEPLKGPFNKLIRNYKNIPDLFFENAAITEIDGIATIYTLSFSEERWATGLSSLDKELIMHHIKSGHIANKIKEFNLDVPPNMSEWIKPIEINSVTIKTLLSKHQINTLDALVIDTEGYDAKILELFDFESIKPRLILYENMHIKDQQKTKQFLSSFGYKVYDCDHNSIAILG